MSSIRIEPTAATLGAVVTGVELRSVSDDQWVEIEAAFHQHAVLVFPEQHLTPGEQTAFGRRFGELSIESLVFTNCADDGSVLPPDDPLVRHLAGNEGWHTDSSFQERAAKASILSAHRVPSAGGETEWADMRAAYDALDPSTRERVHRLSAFHSLYYSQARLGIDPATTASANARLVGQTIVREAVVAAAPLRPLVKVHPVTGRPALFVGRHAYGIPGLDPAQSAELLDRLIDDACRPPRVHTHRWRPGDVAVWDNRCVLHRARPYDPTEARYMVHTRVNGDAATEHAGMVAAPPF
jgi:alpha-ketoglutarate-dependent taurine dioxygenase